MGAETRARVSLWFVLVAALLGFSQVMADQSYRGPAVLGMLFASAFAWGLRRLGRGAILISFVSILALVTYVALVFRAPLTLWGLPTPAALQDLWASLLDAYSHSLLDYAPVPLREGYAVVLIGAAWIATTTGELFTFRWKRPLPAVAIPLAMFAVGIVLGTGEGVVPAVLLFLAALLTYWTNEGTLRLDAWGRRVGKGNASVLLARRIGAGTLAVAFVAPLFLPAIGEGLVSWRSGEGGGGSGGDGAGATIDPWVSIVPRLIAQTDEELFEVRSATSAYWRTHTLEVFDGLNWRELSRERVEAEDGVIVDPDEIPSDATTTLYHEVRVTGLGGSALPAAILPTRAVRLGDGGQADARGIQFDPHSGALTVAQGLAEGELYQIRSEVPRTSFEDLSETSPPERGSGGLSDIYYHLPQGTDENVIRRTRNWASGEEGAFAQLVEIQRRLRGFEYSLNPEQLGTHDALRQFLFETQAGYCQQFATAFAVMARILGYPSRVSVGFLPGVQEPGDSALVVKGTDAHAWPEVHFQGVGWVAFEPTPRDRTATPAYTAPTPQRPERSSPTQDVQRLRDPAASDTAAQRLRDLEGRTADGRPLAEGSGGADRNRAVAEGWRRRSAVLATALVLLAGIILLLTPIAKEVRDRRRVARATGPRGHAEAIFNVFQRHAAELAGPRRPDESARAYALRLAVAEKVSQRDVIRLAALYERASYSPHSVDESAGAEARALTRALRAQLWASATWWARAGHVFSPRALRPAPLVSGPPRSSRGPAATAAARS